MKRCSAVLLASLLAAMPLAAVATVLPDPGPGRTRSSRPQQACAAAKRDQNGTLPDIRFFRLEYMRVIQVGVPETDTVVPEPVVLYIPRGYSPYNDTLQVSEGIGFRFSATYPSFKPVACGDADDDRIEAVFGLESRPQSADALPGSLREFVEEPWLKNEGATFQAAAVPPGFEEAFIVERWSSFDNKRIRTLHLSYRGGHGLLFHGYCDPDAEIPGCEFQTTVPGTYISMSYRMVQTLLPHRQMVESGLQALVARWVADGR